MRYHNLNAFKSTTSFTLLYLKYLFNLIALEIGNTFLTFAVRITEFISFSSQVSYILSINEML